MNATLGDLATRWTVRVALAGYFFGAGLSTRSASPARRKMGRAAWTLGCVCYLAHVACAFHFFHHWSHAAAVERTAEQTALVTGWRWGGGVYVNYAFTAIWLADTIARWLPWPDGKSQPATQVCNGVATALPWWPEAAVQAFMWFIVFNAAVVFGHGMVRWFGLAGCLSVLVAAATRCMAGPKRKDGA